MDDVVYDALIELRTAIEAQSKLQGQANDVMRALISALEETSQEIADLRTDIAGLRGEPSQQEDNDTRPPKPWADLLEP